MADGDALSASAAPEVHLEARHEVLYFLCRVSGETEIQPMALEPHQARFQLWQRLEANAPAAGALAVHEGSVFLDEWDMADRGGQPAPEVGQGRGHLEARWQLHYFT
jgi:hypothetical protein